MFLFVVIGVMFFPMTNCIEKLGKGQQHNIVITVVLQMGYTLYTFIIIVLIMNQWNI